MCRKAHPVLLSGGGDGENFVLRGYPELMDTALLGQKKQLHACDI
jgi:hypothetical protein